VAFRHLHSPALQCPPPWSALARTLGLTINHLLYSAAEAPLLLWDALFFLPHLLGGGALLLAAFYGKALFRGVSEDVSLFLQFGVGALFFLAASAVLVHGAGKTIGCRNAARALPQPTAAGQLVVRELVHRSSRTSYVEFTVGDSKFSTHTRGSADCGFIEPLGKTVSLFNGKTVRLFAEDGTVLRLEQLQ
jgi:hypothetical protein